MKFSEVITILVVCIIVLWVLDACVNKAHADGFYLDTRLSAHQSFPLGKTTAYAVEGGTVYVNTYKLYDINVTRNPYGGLSLGYCKNIRLWALSMQLDVNVSHDSSLDTTTDHGINAINAGMRIWLSKQ